MASLTVDDLLSHIGSLDSADQFRLLEELVALLRRRLGSQQAHSLLELQGLGKDLWKEVDAQQYVDSERASWIG